MSSPPYNSNYGTSVSPPYPSHAPLPAMSKKRPSDASQVSSAKRRKPSMTSNHSAHPLRQTSFPPDGTEVFSAGRSPSVDTMSMVSGSVAGAPVKKKRGRKPKNRTEDAASAAGGRATTAASGDSSRNKLAARGNSVEDDDDDVGEAMDVAMVTDTREEKEKEKRQVAILVDTFDEMQYSRYERWRASKLSDSIVRRLVNQTLSQSVPASCILAVKSVTKIFAGELIERARRVQSQWLEANWEAQTGMPSPPAEEDEHARARRGPLTPDHLREALRRYKLERDGGFVGLLNLARQQYSNGLDRYGLRASGRRLLR